MALSVNSKIRVHERFFRGQYILAFPSHGQANPGLTPGSLQIGILPRPPEEPQRALMDRFPEGQSNNPACRPGRRLHIGGTRPSGNRHGPAEAALSFRWVRLFWMTAGSLRQAMILTAPPQAAHVLMSRLHTRVSRCAYVMDARRAVVGRIGCFAPAALAPPGGGDLDAMVAVVGDHAMNAGEVDSGLGH